MKSIEQKLKQKLVQDAQAFKKTPAQKVHNTIMHRIENTKKAQQKVKSFRLLNWLIPTGFAAAASMLVVMNITPTSISDKAVIQSNLNYQVVKLSKLDIKALSMALESNLTSNIQAEKKALLADLNYIKNIFTL